MTRVNWVHDKDKETVMDMLAIPLWGQLSFLGLSIGLNIFFITRIASGALVPYNRVEAEQRNTALWQHAWEVKEQTSAESTDLVKQLLIVGQTAEKLMNALPKAENANGSPAPPGGVS